MKYGRENLGEPTGQPKVLDLGNLIFPWEWSKEHGTQQINTQISKQPTQVEYPLSKTFWISDLGGLWNICKYIIKYLGDRTRVPNTKFTYVSFSLSTQSLKLIFYTIFIASVFPLWPNTKRSGFYLWHQILKLHLVVNVHNSSYSGDRSRRIMV
jgi:hypothetical protein